MVRCVVHKHERITVGNCVCVWEGGMVLAAEFFFGTVETMASGQITVNKFI